ncbi:MAG: hypothetical protein M3N53_04145 [Actinomycetota bacterium]|nr:hypothetical protein [Actinomycetota bacterium]
MNRSRWAIGLSIGLLIAGLVPARAAESEAKNLKLLDKVEFTGGTELAAAGDYIYAGELNGTTKRNEDPEKGGMHIFDVSGRTPREVGFFSCPGNDNDVEVVRPGLVVMGHHTATCNVPEEGESAAGFVLIDVRNPAKPRQIGSINLPSGTQSHTVKPYPGTNYIYVNPGGLPSNGGMKTHIVDISNPKKPEVKATYVPTGSSTGCHDFSFHLSKKAKLGFCAGYGGFGIWDVSNPLEPKVISTIRNPQIQFNHFAVPSYDGKLLAIDDEAFALHTCKGTPSPTGRAWIYDISDPASPKLQSSITPPRGGDATGVGTYPGWTSSWCLSHGLDWQPGTHNLAITWFTGGVSVHNLDEATAPKEVAYFQAADSNTYSALWHQGRLFTNDMKRGLDVFAVKLGR